jgi:hypothetical protein
MKRYTLLVVLLVMLWATESLSATIGFDSLTGLNLSSFNAHYENGYKEDGFTVKVTGGQWFEAHIFGSSIPAIGSGPLYNDAGVGAPQTITVTGGTFAFVGVDLTSNSFGGTEYTITGSLSGVEKFTFSTTIGSINHFESISSTSSLTVDTLTITGTRAAGVTSFNIDNIRVSEASGPGPPGPGPCTTTTPPCPDPNVPEPASIMLLGVGLAGIEIWRRRRGEG